MEKIGLGSHSLEFLGHPTSNPTSNSTPILPKMLLRLWALEPLFSPLSSLYTIMPGKCGAKFHLSKINFLLDNIKNVMPIAGTEWDTVASIHNEEFPQHARTAESLRWKFQEVVPKTGPTGDPKCPAHVRRAKLILRRKNHCQSCVICQL